MGLSVMVDLDVFGQDFLTDFGEADIPDASLRTLYGLWLAARQGGALPGRADFDPLQMPPAVLPWITIFDVETDPLRFLVRIVGTGIVEATGADTTGQYLDELPSTGAIEERMGWLVGNGKPYFMADLPLAWAHKEYRRYSALGLPLAADGRDVDMLLYGMSFKS